MATIIIGIAILFFLQYGLKWFFEKTKVPDLLIIVAIGYTLGPILGIINPEDLGKVGGVIATTALIVILYEGGINLSAKQLLSSSLPALGITTLCFFSIIALAAGTFFLFLGKDLSTSILAALGIGSTSSAIVIPMVRTLTISDKTKTILGLESAFTDVMAIVLFLLVADSIVLGSFQASNLIIGIGPKTLMAIAMGLGGGLFWAYLKRSYSHLVNMAFAGEAWALLNYGLIEASGYNGAIGVLSLGFMLGNLDLLPLWLKHKVNHIPLTLHDMSLLSEVTLLLRSFFFLYLGILIKFSDPLTVLVAIVVSILIFVTRYLSVKFLFKADKYSRLDAMVASAMGPRGLACAVLATIPLQRGMNEGQWIQDIVFAVIPISILLTAVFVAISENQKSRTIFGKLFSNYSDAVQPAGTNSKNSEYL
jgi:NhaP-type Na+/H+ or K+/H+ antiporter